MAPSQLKQLKAQIHARRTGQQPKQQQPSRKQNAAAQKKARPKSLGEEQRRATLLKEVQSRHKVGGIIDRRIGENDPTMAPEDRMLQRYARQRSKRDSMFNLEDDDAADGGEALLTHGGQAISGLAADDMKDDFDAIGEGLADHDEDELFTRPAKKRRLSEEIAELEARNAAADGEPERKKSKKEVMEEVIAKSKLYKYERQQAKEDDEAIRDELDKGLPDLMALLRGVPSKPKSAPAPAAQPISNGGVHPDRLALMDSDEAKAKQAEKEYDKRLRQMAQDKRAQPTERTKTEEERVKEEAERLKELEEKRMKRMRGEDEESDEEAVPKGQEGDDEVLDDDEDDINEAAEFGLADVSQQKDKVLDVEDEDDFIIDEDLVASGSDLDEEFSEDEEDEEDEAVPDDDEEFLADVLPQDAKAAAANTQPASSLAYTYPCPQNHAELLEVFKNVSESDTPEVIRRIRALYHPQLDATNKEKVSHFSIALVDHVAYMGSHGISLPIVESIIRHIHSLSRTYPETIARAFRAQLASMHERGTLQTGDLYILTAIGTIYPTSDHFHQVVTPAITIMARWLEMNTPRTTQETTIGAYVVALALKYQALSRRYIPEAIRFTLAVFTHHTSATTLAPHIANLTTMLDLYRALPSFPEIFSPFLPHLAAHPSLKPYHHRLNILLQQSLLSRRPLTLHTHRPLPIRTSLPKFEDAFNPTKHYDPDRERAEAAKLRKEYKREKKGAVRELRKDASFLARERLREKRERDAEYERKQRRLVAEIQGEAGREGREYEREKEKRRRARRG